MSNIFGKRPKAPPPAPVPPPAVQEINDTDADRLRILRELRKRRQISILSANKRRQEPDILKRKLGGG